MTVREEERRSRPRSNRVMTFKAWCDLNGFSIPTGRRIIASGDGPPVLRMSARRIGIRVCDNEDWQESRLRRPDLQSNI
jgi:hypothetical protein